MGSNHIQIPAWGNHIETLARRAKRRLAGGQRSAAPGTSLIRNCRPEGAARDAGAIASVGLSRPPLSGRQLIESSFRGLRFAGPRLNPDGPFGPKDRLMCPRLLNTQDIVGRGGSATLSMACRSAMSNVGSSRTQRRTASRLFGVVAIVLTMTIAPAIAQESATQLTTTSTQAATAAPQPAGDAEARRVTSAAETRPVASHGGGAAMDWAQSAGALLVVVALILALRIMLKRITPKVQAASRGGPVEIVARTGVSPRQQLLLVRLGKRMLLLGATPNSMDTLAEIADADEAMALFEAAGRNSDAFRKLLAAKPAEARR